MRRVKGTLQLLLVGILLAMFRPRCAIVCGVNAIRTVVPIGKIETMHHNSKLISGYVPTHQVKETKIPKRPSAPNPVGNHRPPSTI